MSNYPKRLIEVDLPIKRISAHARREKSIRHGHISTLHIWWARRPLAACRAVLCAALWPDPADKNCPQSFREEAARLMQELAFTAAKERSVADLCDPVTWGKLATLRRPDGRLDPANPDHLNFLRYMLLDFIADFANWDASTEPHCLDTARALTQAAHEALGGLPGTRPMVADPFAGGGAIPLEALRIGADTFASDLNPVAVLLNRVVLEYIPKHDRRLADEVRKWGAWVKTQAEKELARFYPQEEDGPTPVAYLWARTITCEGPGCGAEVPLMRSFWLRKSKSLSFALQPMPEPKKKRIDFDIIRNPRSQHVGRGTVRRGKPTCPVCGYSTPLNRVKAQLRSRAGGTTDARLLAVARDAEGDSRFRLARQGDLQAVREAADYLEKKKRKNESRLSFVPTEDTTRYHTFVNRASIYGLSTWEDFYTIRQRLVLGTISQIVCSMNSELIGDPELAVAVKTLLAFAIDRSADYWSSLATWAGSFVAHTFGRQALPFVWDFAEVNPFSQRSGNWLGAVEWIARVVDRESIDYPGTGQSLQANAAEHPLPNDSVSAFFTDPPYYYAIQYADLSDYFYVWLRRTIGEDFPELLARSETPKAEEAIVQSPGDEYRPDCKNRLHYERVMSQSLQRGCEMTMPDGIGTIVFANATTDGWEALLNALISTGWVVTASWPIDTERPGRVISAGRSVLASSVHIVCRPREYPDGSLRDDDVGDWRDVLGELPGRIHSWMPHLAQEGVVGADAIFACLGPALEIYSRYSRVERADGTTVPLGDVLDSQGNVVERGYLSYVWEAVSKEALSMIFEEADTAGFEADARLTAMWLWTLSTADGTAENGKVIKSEGYTLEYDAARKIAQGLGAHLDQMGSLVQIKGDKARLLPVSERRQALFGKEGVSAPRGRKAGDVQMSLFEVETEVGMGSVGDLGAAPRGSTVLDRVHQAMLFFAAGRGEALRRFLVEEGAGQEARFWKLAQALSALYPAQTDEKRWVDGVLARKKGLGF